MKRSLPCPHHHHASPLLLWAMCHEGAGTQLLGAGLELLDLAALAGALLLAVIAVDDGHDRRAGLERGAVSLEVPRVRGRVSRSPCSSRRRSCHGSGA